MVTKNKGSLKNFIAPLLYLEKLVEQTIFNHSFYNSAHLYSDDTKITVVKLIRAAIDIFNNPSKKMNIIIKCFSSTADEVIYTMDLFLNWCLKKSFITFEALPLEIPYMNEELINFFVLNSKNINRTNIYKINIENVCSLMPNIKYFRDCNQKIIDMTSCTLNEQNDEVIEDQKYPEPTSYGNPSIVKLLPNSTKHEVVDHILDALEQIGFDFVNNKFRNKILEKSLFQQFNKLDLKGLIGSYNKINLFEIKLEAIGIDVVVAEHMYYKIIDNNVNGSKAEIRDFIISELDTNFYPLIKDSNQQKKVFGSLFKEHLEKFYEPICKLREARQQDFTQVIESINDIIPLFDEDTGNKLCDYLFKKLFYDLEQVNQWRCSFCGFSNRKLMVGGLWRLYNQFSLYSV